MLVAKLQFGPLCNICIFNSFLLCLLQIYIMMITKEVSSLLVVSTLIPQKHPLAIQTSNRSSSYRRNISFISNKSLFMPLSCTSTNQQLKSKRFDHLMSIFVQFPLCFCIFWHSVSIVMYISDCELQCFCICLHYSV